METWIANEIRKSYINFGHEQPLGYYRDNSQNEIDLVILRDGKLTLIECKSGANCSSSNVKCFERLKDTRYKKGTNAIICTTKEPYSINEKVIALPVSAI